MRAVMLSASQYIIQDIARPQPKDGEVLIKVAYAGVNRADLFQAQGKYPLPESGVPGLEVSGEIIECAGDVTTFSVGDKVCAILSEGAFAEYVAAGAGQVMRVPEGLGLDAAACLPEAAFTTWVSLVWQANLQKGEKVLIHGGASGIGILAIQIARALGADVFATAGSAEKCAACKAAGAHAINYKEQDFVKVVGKAGVDVILDMVGGDYFARNLAALNKNGRLCIIAMLKGAKVEASISPILLKHLTVTGSTLRSRSSAEKAALAQELQEKIWKFIGLDKPIKPMIAQVFPVSEAEKALAFMDKGLNVGKILLKI